MSKREREEFSVALNCAILTRGLSGSATGTRAIADALERHPSVRLIRVSPNARPARGRVWNAFAQSHWDLRGASTAARGAEFLISPCNVGRSRRGQKHVLVIHDTMVLDYPERFDPGYAAYARRLFGFSAVRADSILVPSEFSAACVRAHWPTAATPVVARWPVAVGAVAAKAVSASDTVIMVGETAAHKQHVLGVEAVRFAREQSGLDLKLVLVGRAGGAEPTIRRLLDEHDWFRRQTELSNSGLAETYRNALCLLQPSLVEGYGLPVVEAAATATPAIHSGAGALRELAPGAVSDPSNPRSYADALADLLADPSAYSAASGAALAAASELSAAKFDQSLYPLLSTSIS